MNLANLQPLDDRIVVRLLPDAAFSELIIAPGVAMGRSHVGQVVAAGPGKRNKQGRRQPLDVRPGDVIRFSLNDLEDGDYTLIRQADIFGRVDAC